MRQVDFIVVGQGLAGSALTYHLNQLGKKIALFDNDMPQTSSKVAAGLYNPVTGRKMNKTWKADQLFPYLIEFYKHIESEANCNFLHELNIYRPFKSVEEQNEWNARSGDASYMNYIESMPLHSKFEEAKDELGGIVLKQSGYLDIKVFLPAVKQVLKEKGVFLESDFDEGDLIVRADHVTYKDIQAQQIIFSRGTIDHTSTYFNWLPFAPVKGEIIEFESEMDLDCIVNRGVFVIQIGKHRFKCGSNYENHDLSLEPTAKGREQIEEKLNDLINVTYGIKNHYAGVRPATKDRKPFIGMHPKYKNVGIFNGLGTKGVSLAPYFANQFAHHLVNQSELDEEVNIKRYYSAYELTE